ncbi:hypothetical protein TGRUB_276200 [Toxoplasma gondii RUB]|uniref:Uncharacterized protein n=1 Tax=Toxoplasma gondii RUB TaxID=935652 RepID=A0A086LMZ9_TOXGO|nr:hypothetical protein TGRUB_276200 [Toxoplasma gondii RUB]
MPDLAAVPSSSKFSSPLDSGPGVATAHRRGPASPGPCSPLGGSIVSPSTSRVPPVSSNSQRSANIPCRRAENFTLAGSIPTDAPTAGHRSLSTKNVNSPFSVRTLRCCLSPPVEASGLEAFSFSSHSSRPPSSFSGASSHAATVAEMRARLRMHLQEEGKEQKETAPSKVDKCSNDSGSSLPSLSAVHLCTASGSCSSCSPDAGVSHQTPRRPCAPSETAGSDAPFAAPFPPHYTGDYTPADQERGKGGEAYIIGPPGPDCQGVAAETSRRKKSPFDGRQASLKETKVAKCRHSLSEKTRDSGTKNDTRLLEVKHAEQGGSPNRGSAPRGKERVESSLSRGGLFPEKTAFYSFSPFSPPGREAPRGTTLRSGLQVSEADPHDPSLVPSSVRLKNLNVSQSSSLLLSSAAPSSQKRTSNRSDQSHPSASHRVIADLQAQLRRIRNGGHGELSALERGGDKKVAREGRDHKVEDQMQEEDWKLDGKNRKKGAKNTHAERQRRLEDSDENSYCSALSAAAEEALDRAWSRLEGTSRESSKSSLRDSPLVIEEGEGSLEAPQKSKPRIERKNVKRTGATEERRPRGPVSSTIQSSSSLLSKPVNLEAKLAIGGKVFRVDDLTSIRQGLFKALDEAHNHFRKCRSAGCENGDLQIARTRLSPSQKATRCRDLDRRSTTAEELRGRAPTSSLQSSSGIARGRSETGWIALAGDSGFHDNEPRRTREASSTNQKDSRRRKHSSTRRRPSLERDVKSRRRKSASPASTGRDESAGTDHEEPGPHRSRDKCESRDSHQASRSGERKKSEAQNPQKRLCIDDACVVRSLHGGDKTSVEKSDGGDEKKPDTCRRTQPRLRAGFPQECQVPRGLPGGRRADDSPPSRCGDSQHPGSRLSPNKMTATPRSPFLSAAVCPAEDEELRNLTLGTRRGADYRAWSLPNDDQTHRGFGGLPKRETRGQESEKRTILQDVVESSPEPLSSAKSARLKTKGCEETTSARGPQDSHMAGVLSRTEAMEKRLIVTKEIANGRVLSSSNATFSCEKAPDGEDVVMTGRDVSLRGKPLSVTLSKGQDSGVSVSLSHAGESVVVARKRERSSREAPYVSPSLSQESHEQQKRQYAARQKSPVSAASPTDGLRDRVCVLPLSALSTTDNLHPITEAVSKMERGGDCRKKKSRRSSSMPVMEKLALLLSLDRPSPQVKGDVSTHERQGRSMPSSWCSPDQSACGSNFSSEGFKDSRKLADRSAEQHRICCVPTRTEERDSRVSAPKPSPAAEQDNAGHPRHTVPSPLASQSLDRESETPFERQQLRKAEAFRRSSKSPTTGITCRDKHELESMQPSPSPPYNVPSLLSRSAEDARENSGRDRPAAALVGLRPAPQEVKPREMHSGRKDVNTAVVCNSFSPPGRRIALRKHISTRTGSKAALAASEEETSEAVLVGDSPSLSPLQSPPLLTSPGAFRVPLGSAASPGFRPEQFRRRDASGELEFPHTQRLEEPAVGSQLFLDIHPLQVRLLEAGTSCRGRQEELREKELRAHSTTAWREPGEGDNRREETDAQASMPANPLNSVQKGLGKKEEKLHCGRGSREPSDANLAAKRAQRCESDESGAERRSVPTEPSGRDEDRTSMENKQDCAAALTDTEAGYGSVGSSSAVLPPVKKEHLQSGLEGLRTSRTLSPNSSEHCPLDATPSNPAAGPTPREMETPSPLPSRRRRPTHLRSCQQELDSQKLRDAQALGARESGGELSSATRQPHALHRTHSSVEEEGEKGEGEAGEGAIVFFSPLSIPRRGSCARTQASRESMPESGDAAGDGVQGEEEEGVSEAERRDRERQAERDRRMVDLPSVPSSCRSGGSLTNCSLQSVRDSRSRRSSLASSLLDEDEERLSHERGTDRVTEENVWGHRDTTDESRGPDRTAETSRNSRNQAAGAPISSEIPVAQNLSISSSSSSLPSPRACHEHLGRNGDDGVPRTSCEGVEAPEAVSSSSRPTHGTNRVLPAVPGQESETSLSSFLQWKDKGAVSDREIEDLLDSVEVFLLALDGDGHGLSLRLLERHTRQLQLRPKAELKGEKRETYAQYEKAPAMGGRRFPWMQGEKTKEREQRGDRVASELCRRASPSVEPPIEEDEEKKERGEPAEREESKERTRARLRHLQEQLLAFKKIQNSPEQPHRALPVRSPLRAHREGVGVFTRPEGEEREEQDARGEKETNKAEGGDKTINEAAEDERETVKSPLSSGGSLPFKRPPDAPEAPHSFGGNLVESSIHANAHREPENGEGKLEKTEQPQHKPEDKPLASVYTVLSSKLTIGEDADPSTFGPPETKEKTAPRSHPSDAECPVSQMRKTESPSHSEPRLHPNLMPLACSDRLQSIAPLCQGERQGASEERARKQKEGGAVVVSISSAASLHEKQEMKVVLPNMEERPEGDRNDGNNEHVKDEDEEKKDKDTGVVLEVPKLGLDGAIVAEKLAWSSTPGLSASKQELASGISETIASLPSISRDEVMPHNDEARSREKRETDQGSELGAACTDNTLPGFGGNRAAEITSAELRQEPYTLAPSQPVTWLQAETQGNEDEMTSGVLLSQTPDEPVTPFHLHSISRLRVLPSTAGRNAEPYLQAPEPRHSYSDFLPFSASSFSASSSSSASSFSAASSSASSSASFSAASGVVSSPFPSSCPDPVACGSLSISPFSGCPSRAACLVSRGVDGEDSEKRESADERARDNWEQSEEHLVSALSRLTPSERSRQNSGAPRVPYRFGPPVAPGAGHRREERGDGASSGESAVEGKKNGELSWSSGAHIGAINGEAKPRAPAEKPEEEQRPEGPAEVEASADADAQGPREPFTTLNRRGKPLGEGFEIRREGGEASTFYEGSAEMSVFPHTGRFFEEDPSDDIFSLGDSPAASGPEELLLSRPVSALEENPSVSLLAPTGRTLHPSGSRVSSPRSEAIGAIEVERSLDTGLLRAGAPPRLRHEAPADPTVSEPPARPRVSESETAETRQPLLTDLRGAKVDEGPTAAQEETGDIFKETSETPREHCPAPSWGELSPREEQAASETEPHTRAEVAKEEPKAPPNEPDSSFAWWERSLSKTNRENFDLEREAAQKHPEERAAEKRSLSPHASEAQVPLVCMRSATNRDSPDRPGNADKERRGESEGDFASPPPRGLASPAAAGLPPRTFFEREKEEATGASKHSPATPAEASATEQMERIPSSPSPSLCSPIDSEPTPEDAELDARVGADCAERCDSKTSFSASSPVSPSSWKQPPASCPRESTLVLGSSADSEFGLASVTAGSSSVSASSCGRERTAIGAPSSVCVSPGEEISASIEICAMLQEASPPSRSLGSTAPSGLASELPALGQKGQKSEYVPLARAEKETSGAHFQEARTWGPRRKDKEKEERGKANEDDARLFFSPEEVGAGSRKAPATEGLGDREEREAVEKASEARSGGSMLPSQGGLQGRWKEDLENCFAGRAAGPPQSPAESPSGARPAYRLTGAEAWGSTTLGACGGRHGSEEAPGVAGEAGKKSEAEKGSNGETEAGGKPVPVKRQELVASVAARRIALGQPLEREERERYFAVGDQGKGGAEDAPLSLEIRPRERNREASPELAAFGPRVLAAPAAPKLNPHLFPPRLPSLVFEPSSTCAAPEWTQSPRSACRPHKSSSPASASGHRSQPPTLAARRSVSGVSQRKDRAGKTFSESSAELQESNGRAAGACAVAPCGGLREPTGRASPPPQLAQEQRVPLPRVRPSVNPATIRPQPSASASSPRSSYAKAGQSVSPCSQEQPVADSPLAPPASPEETGTPDPSTLGPPCLPSSCLARAPGPPRALVGRDASKSGAAEPGESRDSRRGIAHPGESSFSDPLRGAPETATTRRQNGDTRKRGEEDGETRQQERQNPPEAGAPGPSAGPVSPRLQDERSDCFRGHEIEENGANPPLSTQNESTVGASASSCSRTSSRGAEKVSRRSGSLGAAVRRLSSKCRVGSIKGNSFQRKQAQEERPSSELKPGDAFAFLPSSRLRRKKAAGAPSALGDPDSSESPGDRGEGPSSGATKDGEKPEREAPQKSRDTSPPSEERPHALVQPAAQALPPPMAPRLSFQSARGSSGGQVPGGSGRGAPGREREFQGASISAHSRSLFRRFSFSSEPAESSVSASGAVHRLFARQEEKHGLRAADTPQKGPEEALAATTKEKKTKRFSLGRRHSVEGTGRHDNMAP